MAEQNLKLTINADTGQAVASIEKLDGALERAGDATRKLPSGFDGLKEKSSVLDEVNGKLETLVNTGKAFLIGMASQAVGSAVGAIGDVMRTVVERGVEYNKTLQDSQSSLSALIMANYNLVDSHGKVLEGSEKVSASFKAARELQQGLEKDAAKTSATYQELVNAFTAGMAPATEMGITDMTRLREVMLAASQAAKTLGVEGHGLAQEMQALFRFESGPDNKLANSLQLSKEKLNELRAAGVDVSKWLLEQLKPYSDAAAASVQNLSVQTSNLQDAIDKAAGKLTKPLFDEIAKSAGTLGKALPELTRGMEDVGKNLAEGTKGSEQLAEALIKLGVHAATIGSEGGNSIGKFTSSLANAIDKLVEIDKRMENATWIATGKSRMELLTPIIERLIGQITGLPVAFGKADKAGEENAKVTQKQTDAAKENVKAEEARIEAKKKATEADKKAADEKARALEAERKARQAMEDDAKALAALADKVQMGRASYADLRAEMDKLAEKHKTTRDVIAALVEQRRLELEQAKESRPVYENVAEAAADEAKARKEQADAIDDVIAARKREREETDAASDAETRARAKAADSGGGPMAWLKDLDGAKAKVDELAQSVENVGKQWIIAREAVVTYQGTLRDASEESRALDESQKALLDTLTKIARSNEKTSAWMTQYIDELQRAMELGGKGWADQGKMLDDFLDKVRNTHYWMSQMNAEFVLGGSMYGDISRDFGSMASALDEFRQALVSPKK